MTTTETPSDPRPWWRQPTTLVVLGLLVLAAGIGVGLILSSGDDDGGTEVSTAGTAPTTAPTTAAPTTAAPPTTQPTVTTAPARDRCLEGDLAACDSLPDDVLDELCDDGHGNEDACQALVAHQGGDDPVGEDDEGDEGDPED